MYGILSIHQDGYVRFINLFYYNYYSYNKSLINPYSSISIPGLWLRLSTVFAKYAWESNNAVNV